MLLSCLSIWGAESASQPVLFRVQLCKKLLERGMGTGRTVRHEDEIGSTAGEGLPLSQAKRYRRPPHGERRSIAHLDLVALTKIGLDDMGRV